MHQLNIVDVDPKCDLICYDIGQLCDALAFFLQYLKKSDNFHFFKIQIDDFKNQVTLDRN